VIKGVHEMEMVRSRTLDEIKDWRDDRLVKILRLVRVINYNPHPTTQPV
jgi:hypothetical protein